ncbi:MAG: hypothetical protein HY396_01470 [Candidatus Doudnabacteria bacterium]|nr:hypothetical protein [Candidatus Doudnabacteria bacterium]
MNKYLKAGKFIVIYGINNLGKTTQAKLLVEKLKRLGRKAEYLKYPVYDLEPSGPMINAYLREGNPVKLSAREVQILYAMNRWQYEPILRSKLEKGIDIVAEDYWGTGVAWGAGAGVDKEFLLRLNGFFLREDLALLFAGKRFASGLENNHLYETDSELTKRVEVAHNELGKEFGWKLMDANQSIEKVAEEVWKLVETVIPVKTGI